MHEKLKWTIGLTQSVNPLPGRPTEPEAAARDCVPPKQRRPRLDAYCGQPWATGQSRSTRPFTKGSLTTGLRTGPRPRPPVRVLEPESLTHSASIAAAICQPQCKTDARGFTRRLHRCRARRPQSWATIRAVTDTRASAPVLAVTGDPQYTGNPGSGAHWQLTVSEQAVIIISGLKPT